MFNPNLFLTDFRTSSIIQGVAALHRFKQTAAPRITGDAAVLSIPSPLPMEGRGRGRGLSRQYLPYW